MIKTACFRTYLLLSNGVNMLIVRLLYFFKKSLFAVLKGTNLPERNLQGIIYIIVLYLHLL